MYLSSLSARRGGRLLYTLYFVHPLVSCTHRRCSERYTQMYAKGVHLRSRQHLFRLQSSSWRFCVATPLMSAIQLAEAICARVVPPTRCRRHQVRGSLASPSHAQPRVRHSSNSQPQQAGRAAFVHQRPPAGSSLRPHTILCVSSRLNFVENTTVSNNMAGQRACGTPRAAQFLNSRSSSSFAWLQRL